MQEIHILSGPPGCGKTTKAHELVAQQPRLIYLSRDVLRAATRAELGSTEYFPVPEKVEWENWTTLINRHVDAGDSVIIDQTTLGASALVKLFKSINITDDSIVIVHVFLTSLEQCQFRNGFREGFEYVPPEVLKKMHERAFKDLSVSILRRLLLQAEKTFAGGSVKIYR